jgi:hypothetical protein
MRLINDGYAHNEPLRANMERGVINGTSRSQSATYNFRNNIMDTSNVHQELNVRCY